MLKPLKLLGEMCQSSAGKTLKLSESELTGILLCERQHLEKLLAVVLKTGISSIQ